MTELYPILNECLRNLRIGDGKVETDLGYPESPFSRRLATNLEYWILHKGNPFDHLPKMELLPEQKEMERDSRLKKIKQLHIKEWKTCSDETKKEILIEALTMLGLRGILDLLGLRNTEGSTTEVFLPRRDALMDAFQKTQSPKAKLTVGARALSKHCHRDGSNQWWGICTGSEEAKNAHALAIAEKILDTAAWINIHTIVHGTQVLEMRNMEGYGLRLFCKDLEFRGFLEPQMEDGHVAKWRH